MNGVVFVELRFVLEFVVWVLYICRFCRIVIMCVEKCFVSNINFFLFI